ncbi:nucleotidyltransferase domain-containing protein [bacterium]|nr:nucleotidyltransferase domain-containing protein [bacterium]
MKKDEIIKETAGIVREYVPNDCKIYIFGSWAKGNALETSDIDIGILGKEKVAWNSMAKILEEVEDIRTLRSIDIVDLNSVDKSFKDNVMKHAKILN